MANEFICSDCKGDGTRCDCHKKRKPTPWQPSAEDLRQRELAEIRAGWRKLGLKSPV